MPEAKSGGSAAEESSSGDALLAQARPWSYASVICGAVAIVGDFLVAVLLPAMVLVAISNTGDVFLHGLFRGAAYAGAVVGGFGLMSAAVALARREGGAVAFLGMAVSLVGCFWGVFAVLNVRAGF